MDFNLLTNRILASSALCFVERVGLLTGVAVNLRDQNSWVEGI